jgi:hypothetical protein
MAVASEEDAAAVCESMVVLVDAVEKAEAIMRRPVVNSIIKVGSISREVIPIDLRL